MTVLAAQHIWTHPALKPAGEGWYSIHLSWRDGRLSWPRWPDYTPAENQTHEHYVVSPTAPHVTILDISTHS